MARVEVVMPQMGESIAEGTIVKWHKKVGDPVKKDETLLEISTDKVDSEIPSPSAGVLTEILVEEQKTVPVRTVIAYLDPDAAAPAPSPKAPAPEKPVEAAPAPPPRMKMEPPAETGGGTPAGSPRFYSPLVLTIAQQEGVPMGELESIRGTGEGGRVTKKDVLSYVENRRKGGAKPEAAPITKPSPVVSMPQPADSPELSRKYPPPDFEVLQMPIVMQKMAQHMVASVQTSPHVHAIHEVDMTAVAKHRLEQAAAFEAREGYKLTYTPYIVSAVVKAMKKYPLVNSSLEGDKIIRKNAINIGVAVATENGLLVPVVKHAEEKNFLGLARAVHDLASRARTKKLTPDDVQSGTFTISNFGVFGTMIGTPIINQPQVAILGTGAVKKRVAVIDDALAIRSIAYFTLSFDHRVIDGALGGMFLEEVVQNLQNFDTSLRFA